MSSQSLAFNVTKVSGDSARIQSDRVAAEEPLEIRIGYRDGDARTTASVSVTMRTPGNDIELATGFLLSEAIITSADAILTAEHVGEAAPDTGNHNIVRIDLAADVNVDLGRLQRHFYTTSSCGVCGKSSLDALATVGAQRIKNNNVRFRREMLAGLPTALRHTQATFDETGGLHAAAVFDSNGDIVLSREDGGRHNAVDKVVGAMLAGNQLPCSDVGLMVSGRASFELVQKGLMAGFPLLAAVSAPSSLAIQLANEFNLSLVGFLRGDTFNIYTAEERII